MANFMHSLKKWHRAAIIILLVAILNGAVGMDLSALGFLVYGSVAILLAAFVLLCIKFQSRESWEESQRAERMAEYKDAEKKANEATAQLRQEEYRRLQEQRAEEERQRKERQAEWERTHGRLITRIAGVTFKNDDGSSRQKYLKEAFVNEGIGELSFEEYEYEGKPAIRVCFEGGCIGNIPASDVEKVKSVLHRVTAPALDVERFHPDEDSSEVIYRADLTLVYKK